MNNKLASLKDIELHLNKYDFDVGKSKNARWIDQKVTPDILSAIAESILNHREANPSEEFTMRTLWDDPKLSEIMTSHFSKPELTNSLAGNEYDKVISQPLLTLAYSRVIALRKQGRRNFYSLNTDTSILRFIAHRDVNSYKFLCLYIEKVLKDSGLLPSFNEFFTKAHDDKLTTNDYKILKKTFKDFIIKNTQINGEVEVNRIFTKVLNPLAVNNKSRGTDRGFLSKKVITYSNILYNQPNFRDLDKDKNLTREEYQSLLSIQPAYARFIQKAKNQVRERYNNCTEVSDGSELTSKTEIHHIFMAHERPQLAAHIENLINLTSNQHRNNAHPSADFKVVDPAYQKLCLQNKIRSTEKSVSLGDGFYNKEKLLEVLNEGFGEELFSDSNSFTEINLILEQYYNSRYHV